MEITSNKWFSLSREQRKTFTGCVTWPSGLKFHYYNGKYHNENGPAIRYPDDKCNEYYINNVKTSKYGLELYREATHSH